MVPPDLESRLRSGGSLRVLFDANVLLDVFLLRDNAVPAARALNFAAVGAVKGHVCASAFGVICHHGAGPGQGRGRRERLLATELMLLLSVLPLAEDVLRAALGYGRLSFEDAQVAAAGDLADVDAILTSDGEFLRNHRLACSPRALVDTLEQRLGIRPACRVVRVSPEGAFRMEILDPAGTWRQTLPLAGFTSREAAERVAGIWKEQK